MKRSMRVALPLCALLTPVVARADWYEASGPHFVVYSNQSLGRVKEFTAELERYDKALHIARGVPDYPVAVPNRVTVFVVSPDLIEDLGGAGVAGFYRGTAGRPVAFVRPVTRNNDKWDLDAMSVLRHEYAHHFMFNNFETGALPTWFVEGFAEFYATAITNSDGTILFGQAPAYRARALFDGPSMSIKEILAPDPKKKFDLTDINILYGKGWLLLHYLTFTPSRKGQLGEYIKALNSGKSPLEAAGAFGDLKTLDRELDHYMVSPKFDVLTIPASALKIGDVTIRPLTPGEAATMRIRIRSNAGVDRDAARQLVEKARHAAEPFPEDAGAQLALAEAEYDAGSYDASEQAAERALVADPKREKALVYRGMAMMAAALAKKSTDPAIWKAARTPLLAANHLEPADPEPPVLYYRSFIDAGQAPTANALNGLRAAFQLAPQDFELRADMVVAMLRAGNLKEARDALVPIAFDPHGGKFAQVANALLVAIDSGDKAAIDDKLDHFIKRDDGEKKK